MKFLPVLLTSCALSTAFVVTNGRTKTIRSALRVVDSVGLGEYHRAKEDHRESELPLSSSSSSLSSSGVGADSDCEEYAYLIRSLSANLRHTKEKRNEIKQTVHRLSTLERNHPGVAKLGKLPAHLKLALTEARAVNDAYGIRSKQAETAWRNVTDAHSRPSQEGSSSAETQLETQFATEIMDLSATKGHEHDTGTVLDMDSLDDVMDGLTRIEQLAFLAEIEKERVDKIMDLF